MDFTWYKRQIGVGFHFKYIFFKDIKDIEANPKEKNGGTKTFLFYIIVLNSKATLNI